MKYIVSLAFVLICCHTLWANSTSKKWIAVGGGAGTEGIALYANGSFQVSNKTVLSVRIAQTGDFTPVNNDDGFFSGGEKFYPGVSDVGILYGFAKINSKEDQSFSISVGYGSVTVVEKGEWTDNWLFSDYWSKVQQTTDGFLFQSQYFMKKFGLILFADFNSVTSFGGIVFCYRFNL